MEENNTRSFSVIKLDSNKKNYNHKNKREIKYVPKSPTFICKIILAWD